MKQKNSWLKLAAAALTLQAATAWAAPVWTNGTPDFVNGSVMSDTYQAEDFSLGSSTTLTGITFWSVEAAGAFSGSISWEIFSGVPGGTVVASGSASTITRTAAGSLSGLNVIQNQFSVSVADLAAGTYWLAMHNGSISSTAFNDFYWATAADNASARGRELWLVDPSSGWTTNGYEHAFSIDGRPGGGGAAPEPSTAALAVLAMMGVVAQRLRRPQSV